MNQYLIIRGEGLSRFTSCGFKHRNTTESQIVHINSTSIKCQLPLLFRLKGPRSVNITLKIDEENSYLLPQPIQYIPKLTIIDYSLSSQLDLQLDNYITSNLPIYYQCVLTIANSTKKISTKGAQRLNIIECHLANNFDTTFESVALEYFYQG